MVKNDESMDATISVLFHWKCNNYEKDAKSSNPSTLQNLSISLGNMKILKISRSNQKSGSPRMLIITVVFEEKTMLRLQDKKDAVQECLQLLSFLDDVDDNNGPKRDGAVRNCEYYQGRVTKMTHPWIRTRMTQYVIVSFLGATATF